MSALLPAQSLQTADLTNAELLSLPLPDGATGAHADTIFGRYGVTFGGNGAMAQLALEELPPVPVTPAPPFPVVKNVAPNGQDLPLVIDFGKPVRKIRFQFFKGGAGNHASVTGYDREGTLLGALDFDIASNPMVGITASNPQGISKLVVKYLGTNKDEEVLELAVEFVSTPIFATVLPQIATGSMGGGRSLETEITVLNVSNTRATGDIRFYNDSGDLSSFPFVNRPATWTIALDLDPDGLFSLRTRSDAYAQSGYATIISSGPMQATASFRTKEGSVLISEVSLASVPPWYTVKGSFERFKPSGTVGGGTPQPIIDSAFGIVNLSDQETTVVISTEEAGLLPRVFITLQPGQHYARFIKEIFPEIEDSSAGVFRIVSGTPIAATLVRTSDGSPVSILPLASLEK